MEDIMKTIYKALTSYEDDTLDSSKRGDYEIISSINCIAFEYDGRMYKVEVVEIK